MINDDEEVEAKLITIKEEHNEFEDINKARICVILTRKSVELIVAL